MTDKSRKVSYTWVEYGTGPLKGLFTVRRTVEEDYASFQTKADAMAFISQQALEKPTPKPKPNRHED